MSDSKKQYLYKLIIDNLEIDTGEDKLISSTLLGNLPKDKYTTDEVISAINFVQNKVDEISQKDPLFFKQDDFRQKLLKLIIAE